MGRSAAISRIVLIGAGHAHLHVAKHARRLIDHGAQVTLIDPDRFWYSGLATGMLGGAYEPQQNDLDPRPLIEQAGGRFLRDRLVSLDRDNRMAHLASGETVAYDAISLNVGSKVPTEKLPGADEHAWPVKPISNLHRLRRYLETCFAIDCVDRLAVVGGGATGCEVACNLAELARRHHSRAKVTLLTRGPTVLRDAPAGAGKFMLRWLRRVGVEVQVNAPVQRIESRAVVLRDGRSARAELIILATGLRASPLMAAFGLPVGEDGGLRVTAALHSPADERVFAVGDCAAFGPRPLPKVGVFGVRQAPVLLDNLLAMVRGQPLREYEPQRQFLRILNLGRGRGLAIRGNFWAHGRWCMRWKDRLDRKFLQQYRT